MGVKREINPVEAVRNFPAFPLVLAAVGGNDENVITIGLVHVFSFRPTIIGLGISPSRYSHELFQSSSDFTINVPAKDLVEEAMFCGMSSGRNVNKFIESGLITRRGKSVRSPVLDDCPLIFECVKKDTIDIGDHTWFFGEVVRAEIDADFDREKLLLYWGDDFRSVGEIIRKKG